MKISDLGTAKALADCSAELSLFESAESREEVMYLKMFRSDGKEVAIEYHLGGLSIIPDLIAEERGRLNAKMDAVGLERPTHINPQPLPV